jgi:hypothetical protein
MASLNVQLQPELQIVWGVSDELDKAGLRQACPFSFTLALYLASQISPDNVFVRWQAVSPKDAGGINNVLSSHSKD